MKVLIVGAGIGGLTAALCLDRAGHDVQLIEQADQFGEIGAGIQCGANALKVIDHLDLRVAVEAVSIAPERAEFLDHKTGRVLYSLPWGSEYRAKYGAPYLHIKRSDLHSILAAAFKQRTTNRIELNTCVDHYEEHAGGITVFSHDGRSFSGDCLIGADGLKSIIKYQLLGATLPLFTGNVAWRGVVQRARLPNNFMDKVASNFMGPGKHMVIYYIRDQQLVNFVGVVENPDRQDDSWVAKAPWQELQADFVGWHPTVQAVINAVDKDQCYRWALHQHQPLTNWSSNRVTLLGDAAHATLPFMASGAALAMEDARVLQRSIDQTETITQALQLYQRNRIPRTTKIQIMSVQAGKLYHIRNSSLLKLAFAGLNVFAPQRAAYLADYDANTVTLK